MSIADRLIIGTDAAAWDRALCGTAHAIAHTWAYSSAMAATSGAHPVLLVIEDANARVICPLIERPWERSIDVATHYGFSGFASSGTIPGFADAWLRALTARDYICAAVGSHPALPLPADLPPQEMYYGANAYVLDLRQDLPDIERKMAHGHRYALARWRRGPQRIVTDRKMLATWFLDQYPRMMQRVGAAATYHFSRKTLETILKLDDVILFGAQVKGRIEAVAAFGVTPYTADYLWNASTPTGRDHSRGLLWAAIERFATQGVPVLNLGGGIRPGDGLERFKAGFGARPVPRLWLKQVVRAVPYERLCQQAGASATERSGFFPAYRAAEAVAPGAAP